MLKGKDSERQGDSQLSLLLADDVGCTRSLNLRNGANNSTFLKDCWED